MHRPATFGALRTAGNAAGSGLDAVSDCAFVTGIRRSGPARPRSASAECRPGGGAVAVRPRQTALLPRPQQHHRTEH